MTDPIAEPNQPGAALPPETTAALLARALRARQSGDTPAARALLRALAAQQPAQPQVWLALATVAESRAEQRLALQRALAIDPTNALAQRGLAQMDRLAAAAPTQRPQPALAPIAPQAAPPAPVPAPRPPAEAELAEPAEPAAAVRVAPALTPAAPTAEERARAIRWPLYVVLAVAALAVLLAAWWLRQPGAAPGPLAVAPTAALPGAAPAPTAPVSEPTSQPAAEAPASTPTTPATPLPTPQPTAVPTLALGQVVQSGQWHVVLLRPNDALPLDGAIGTLQPRGRFFLALLAIGNNGTAAARLPSDLVALVDADGRSYAPDPALSAAYLAEYGRGLRGDLSMDDLIPADGGNKSIPLIFDLPAGARGLTLTVQGAPFGWLVEP